MSTRCWPTTRLHCRVQGGKTDIVGFLVGQVMKATAGKANPKVGAELLTKKPFLKSERRLVNRSEEPPS